MTQTTRNLLVVVTLLVLTQWVVLPVIGWQGQVRSEIERGLSGLSAREAVIEALPQMERERTQRLNQLSSLSSASFPQGPSAILEIQRWVTASLEGRQLNVDKFEWSPQSEGAISVVTATVDIKGGEQQIFEWLAELHMDGPWIGVEGFQLRRAGRRSGGNRLSGRVTLKFVLENRV